MFLIEDMLMYGGADTSPSPENSELGFRDRRCGFGKQGFKTSLDFGVRISLFLAWGSCRLMN